MPRISHERSAPRSVSVLVVEDNLGYAYFVRTVLQGREDLVFEVAHATDLAAGKGLLEGTTFDVVLLDLGLPDSRGVETFSRIQATAPQTPVIILTVLDDDTTVRTALRSGAQDYIVKDALDGDMLVRAIRYAVDRAEAERSLRDLSGRLLQMQDEERRRIARGLHDSTAQNLAALTMNLALLRSQLAEGGPRAAKLLEESLAFAEQCSTEVRTLSYLLHPPLLDELGLAGAAREYADGFAERSGIRVDLELPARMGRLPREIETALFRVLQESLTNVHRHSGSKTASIGIAFVGATVRMAVRDAGRGMDPGNLLAAGAPVAGLGVGIAGMRERVRQLGGRLEVESDGHGTVVTATLPCDEARE